MTDVVLIIKKFIVLQHTQLDGDCECAVILHRNRPAVLDKNESKTNSDDYEWEQKLDKLQYKQTVDNIDDGNYFWKNQNLRESFPKRFCQFK